MSVDTLKFWQAHALEYIKPYRNGAEFPEGQQITDAVRARVGEHSVLDFGCGYGRLCSLFRPEKYIGIDICEEAIASAKQKHPDYTFRHIQPFEPLPQTEYVLAHTVLLHHTGNSLARIMCQLVSWSPVIVVVEVMDSKWAQPEGAPPTFNRPAEEYDALFALCGYSLRERQYIPYPAYANTAITVAEFVTWKQ